MLHTDCSSREPPGALPAGSRHRRCAVNILDAAKAAASCTPSHWICLVCRLLDKHERVKKLRWDVDVVQVAVLWPVGLERCYGIITSIGSPVECPDFLLAASTPNPSCPVMLRSCCAALFCISKRGRS